MTKFCSAAETRSKEIACLGLMLLDHAIEIANTTQIATRTYRFGPLAIALQTAGREYSQRLTSTIDFACNKDRDAAQVLDRQIMIHEERQELSKNVSDDENETENDDREKKTHDELAADVAIDQFHRLPFVSSVP